MIDELYLFGRNLFYKELRPLFEKLATIKYAVVKGEVLSQQIYGKPNKRKSNDIDILVDKKNVKIVEDELKKLGFKQSSQDDSIEARNNRVLCMTCSHQIPSYHKEKFGFHFNVDINFDIFWGEYEGERCSIEDFLIDTLEMNVYEVSIKTLPPEKAFVQMILHHYREMNSIYQLSFYNCINQSCCINISINIICSLSL